MASWMRGRGRKPQPAHVRIIRGKTEKNAWLRIELREGRQHQVKKMCEAVGHSAIKLIRRAYAGITARGLPGARVRTLTRDEVEKTQGNDEKSKPPRRSARLPGQAGPRPERTRKRTARKGAANQKTKEPGKSRPSMKHTLDERAGQGKPRDFLCYDSATN